jgi:hypothetical protein
MRYQLLFLSVSICVYSCVIETAVEHDLSTDSLVADVIKMDWAALYETRTEVDIPDYMLVDEDTILVNQGQQILTRRPTRSEPNQWTNLDANQFLVVKAVDNSFCELNIYDSKGDSIGRGFMSLETALRLTRPEIQDLKVTFYNTHKMILRGYRIALCEKYKISEDELDSLSSYSVLQEFKRFRGRFDKFIPNQE